LRRFRGNKKSECDLLDSRAAALRLGAKYNARTTVFSFPLDVAQRLRSEVFALREKQQGKKCKKDLPGIPKSCESLTLRVSHRNAGVSPERRQRSTKETQMGTHLLREERRNEEIPTPTPPPADHGDAQQDKDSPGEDDPDGLLRRAIAKFTGPMNDLGDYLFNTSRPPMPHTATGGEEWKSFEFDTLAVEAAEWCGGTLALTLSASDPAAARAGLKKYWRTWEPSLRRWYGCKVRWAIQERGQA
jgi:hypothetical protein